MSTFTLDTATQFIHGIAHPIIILDGAHILASNTTFDKLTDHDTLTGQPLTTLMPDVFHNDLHRWDRKTPFRTLLHIKDDGYRHVELHAGQAVTPRGVIVSLTNLDSRVVLENGMDAYYTLRAIHDDTGRVVDFMFTDANAAALKQAKRSRDELIGRSLLDLYPENASAGQIELYTQLMQTGDIFEEEYYNDVSAFEIGWFYHQIVPVQDGITIFNRNITERKEWEIELERSRELLSSINNNIQGGLFRSTPNKGLLYVSEGFVRLFGYDTAEEVLALPPETLHAHPSRRNEIIQTDVHNPYFRNFEVEYMRKDGSTFWGLNNGKRVFNDDGSIRYYDGAIIDITDRKQAQEALRQSRDHFKMLMDQASDGVVVIDGEGRIVQVNARFCELTGYDEQNLVGMSMADMVHEADFAELTEDIQQAVNGHNVISQYRLRQQSGAYLRVESSSRRLDNGNFMSVIRDITERLRVQEALLEKDRLRMQLDKERELNETKNTMMSTVTHEFRTPLAIISTATENLERYFERYSPNERAEKLQSIRTQIAGLSKMLEDMSLLRHGKIDRPQAERSTFDLAHLVRLLVDDLQHSICADHHLEMRIDTRSRYIVHADSPMLTRMLMNLVANAAKYSEQGTTITVSIRMQRDNVAIDIADEGIGITEADAMNIFEPFYRSKGVRHIRGIGLGLAIVQDAVLLHDGTLSFTSTPGEGTTFHIRLPILAVGAE